MQQPQPQPQPAMNITANNETKVNFPPSALNIIPSSTTQQQQHRDHENEFIMCGLLICNIHPQTVLAFTISLIVIGFVIIYIATNADATQTVLPLLTMVLGVWIPMPTSLNNNARMKQQQQNQQQIITSVDDTYQSNSTNSTTYGTVSLSQYGKDIERLLVDNDRKWQSFQNLIETFLNNRQNNNDDNDDDEHKNINTSPPSSSSSSTQQKQQQLSPTLKDTETVFLESCMSNPILKQRK